MNAGMLELEVRAIDNYQLITGNLMPVYVVWISIGSLVGSRACAVP
jgi:hypothetical protein